MPIDFLSTNRETGDLRAVPDCWIQFGNDDEDRVELYALPQISDRKDVSYSDQPIQGRSAPVKTYSNSSNRSINFTIHLFVTKNLDIERNLNLIRRISALAHPEYNNTYLPPRIARLKCGKLLGEDANGIPVVLKNYEVTYDTNVQWFYDEQLKTYMPLHVELTTSWDVVYSWQSLPGHDDVLIGNY